MIEKDIAHLRFLHTQVMKGHVLSNDDMDFVLKKKTEIENILNGVNEMVDTTIKILNQC